MLARELPQDCTVSTALDALKRFSEPFHEMWPWFSVKLAAIKAGERWDCIYLGGAGCFKEPELAGDPYTTDMLVTSTWTVASEDWWIFVSKLIREGAADTPYGRVHIPTGAIVPTWSPWSPRKNSAHYGTADLRERTEWSMLAFEGRAGWDGPYQDISVLTANVKQSILEHTNWEGEVASFFFKQVGNYAVPGVFRIELDLPLGITVQKARRLVDGGKLDLRISALPPLYPPELRIVYSADGKYRDNAPFVPAEPTGEVTDTGPVREARAIIPIRHGLVSIRHPLLGRPLNYDFPEVSSVEQLKALIAFAYDARKPERGEKRWQYTIKSGGDTPLELALLNAIAGFGWPVMFTGYKRESAASGNDTDNHGERPQTEGLERTTADKNGRASYGYQPQTEGFDLVVLDFERKRLLLVSVKGIDESRVASVVPEAGKLNNMMARVAQLLPGWKVYGRMVCNKIPGAKLGAVAKDIEGIEYSDEDWVEDVVIATDRAAAEHLIWPYESFADPLGRTILRGF